MKATANTLDKQTTWYRTHEESLSKAVKAVNASKAAKLLDTARANLKAKLEEASKLLADSDGKVAVGAVRDMLSKAIDAAGKLVDGNDPSKLDKARTSLEDAVGKVNDSVKAKQDADARAEAQAAAETQAPSYGGYTGHQSGGYAGYTGGGTSAPTYNPTPAPAPTPDPQAPEEEDICFTFDTSGKPGTEVPCSSL